MTDVPSKRIVKKAVAPARPAEPTSNGNPAAPVKKAVANGGTHAMPPQDHDFMYASSFYDPDGHHWEVLWMDPKHIQK